MAYIVMAFIVTAYMVMAFIVMATWTSVAVQIMSYIVTVLYSYDLYNELRPI